MPQSRRLGAAVLALALLLGAAPAAAGEEGTEERTSLLSFNESQGCGAAAGIRGPYATTSGGLASSEAILGPWGDFFGRDIGEVRSNLLVLYLPSPGGKVGVYVHERVAPALRAVIRNLEREAAAGRTYNIRRWDTWSYSSRTVPPHRHLSFHAVGAALDVNAASNPYRGDNVLVTDMPAWFVKAWTDAGWCWGGDWEEIKDPMHFSWQGPLATPGYVTPAPLPPRTAAGNFGRSLSFDTVLGESPEGSRLLLADIDRDGAPDAVRVRSWTPAGHLGVEAAQAIHGFETCYTGEATAAPAVAGAALLLADRDGDGRPDLWQMDTSGETAVLTAYTFASGYSRRLAPAHTEVPTSDGMVFLTGDHDRDRRTDLYVVRPGDPATIEVWRGPHFTLIAQAALPFSGGEGWRYALGDRDVDGVPDLYAIDPGDPDRVIIIPGASGFIAAPQEVTTAAAAHPGSFSVGDLDGDGRSDLYFLEDDGTVTVYLGGNRGTRPDSELIYWFYEGHDRHWEYGQGCPVDPGATFKDVDAAGAGFAMAALYQSPLGAGWVLDGWAPGAGRFSHILEGSGVALSSLATPQGDRFAVLQQVEGNSVADLYYPSGIHSGRVDFGPLLDPIGLVPLSVDGAPALGVLEDRGLRAAVTVRALDHTPLAVVRLGPIEPIGAAAMDADGDGTSELAVLGTGPGGDTLLRVVGLDGAIRAEATLPAGRTAESLAVVSGTMPAVLLRDEATGQAAVEVFDASLEGVSSMSIAPNRSAVLAAAGGDVVVAFRATRTGAVWVLAGDALTGERHYARKMPSGFDPAAAATGPSGNLVLGAHRLGDGAVLTDQRDPEGSLVARVEYFMR